MFNLGYYFIVFINYSQQYYTDNFKSWNNVTNKWYRFINTTILIFIHLIISHNEYC